MDNLFLLLFQRSVQPNNEPTASKNFDDDSIQQLPLTLPGLQSLIYLGPMVDSIVKFLLSFLPGGIDLNRLLPNKWPTSIDFNRLFPKNRFSNTDLNRLFPKSQNNEDKDNESTRKLPNMRP